MELLNLKFAILVFKLTLCILPFLAGIKLLFFVSDKDKIRRKLSTQLLGEPELLQFQVFNVFFYFSIVSLVLIGTLFSFVFFIL